MKQIFDWMRRQPLKAFKVYDGTIGIEPPEVHKLINEAEAKWESECCEYENMGSFYKPSCNDNIGEFISWVDLRHYKFCPYCGKPIKISEVE